MDLDDFPDELEQFRREHYRQYPQEPLAYTASQIERMVAYVVHRRSYGDSVAQCSERLGITAGRLRRWVYQRRRVPFSRDLAPPASLPPLSMLLPVQVRAEQVRVPDGVPERRYTVRSPTGFEVRDLRLDELVELLRSLQ